MDDPQAPHASRGREPSGALAGRLLVVVPSGLSSRMGYFADVLAGSEIEVIVDRRRAARRGGSTPRVEERRRGDRRGPPRLLGHAYGCRIVRVDQPASS